MRTILFYRTLSGKCPVQDHLESLRDEQATKIAWVLKLIRELDQVPSRFFKKLVNTDDIWEVRVSVGGNIFRLLGFLHGNKLIVLPNSFQKKSQKTPKTENEPPRSKLRGIKMENTLFEPPHPIPLPLKGGEGISW